MIKSEKGTFITIVTPTYNRGYILTNLFNSLKNQTDKRFNWLIIDDGSTDNTKEIVDRFDKTKFNINYVYKNNGGKHTALNIAFSLVKDELFFIVDSDDYILEHAIEMIKKKWDLIKNKNLCGISFLRMNKDFEVIGDKYPKDEYVDNFINVRINDNIKGDKAEVWVTKYLQEFSYPEYEKERFMGESYVWVKLARKYDMLFVNEGIYITEYISDGLTKSGRKLMIENPKGGMDNARTLLEKDVKFRVRIKNSCLFICYGFFAKNSIREIISKVYNKQMIKMNIIFGYLLYLYWKWKYFKILF